MYIQQLAQQVANYTTEASANSSALLDDEQDLHSAQLRQLTAQHKAELASLQQQLVHAEADAHAQCSNQLEYYKEQHKSEAAQMVTYLTWERDDSLLTAATQREANVNALVSQHEQQVGHVQSAMSQQHAESLEAILLSTDQAAQSAIAQGLEWTQCLHDLHAADVEITAACARLTRVDVLAEHEQHLQQLCSDWQQRVIECEEQAAVSATQTSQAKNQAQIMELCSSHAGEIARLEAAHQQQLDGIDSDRARDRTESESHIVVALQRLSDEHSSQLSMAVALACDEQQHLLMQQQEQLLEVKIEHDSCLEHVTLESSQQLDSLHSHHEAELSQLLSEHGSQLHQMRQQAESAQQLHLVCVTNMQLEHEQLTISLRSELESVKACLAEAVTCSNRWRAELQVSIRVVSLWLTLHWHVASPMPKYSWIVYTSNANPW